MSHHPDEQQMGLQMGQNHVIVPFWWLNKLLDCYYASTLGLSPPASEPDDEPASELEGPSSERVGDSLFPEGNIELVMHSPKGYKPRGVAETKEDEE